MSEKDCVVVLDESDSDDDIQIIKAVKGTGIFPTQTPQPVFPLHLIANRGNDTTVIKNEPADVDSKEGITLAQQFRERAIPVQITLADAQQVKAKPGEAAEIVEPVEHVEPQDEPQSCQQPEISLQRDQVSDPHPTSSEQSSPLLKTLPHNQTEPQSSQELDRSLQQDQVSDPPQTSSEETKSVLKSLLHYRREERLKQDHARQPAGIPQPVKDLEPETQPNQQLAQHPQPNQQQLTQHPQPNQQQLTQHPQPNQYVSLGHQQNQHVVQQHLPKTVRELLQNQHTLQQAQANCHLAPRPQLNQHLVSHQQILPHPQPNQTVPLFVQPVQHLLAYRQPNHSGVTVSQANVPPTLLILPNQQPLNLTGSTLQQIRPHPSVGQQPGQPNHPLLRKPSEHQTTNPPSDLRLGSNTVAVGRPTKSTHDHQKKQQQQRMSDITHFLKCQASDPRVGGQASNVQTGVHMLSTGPSPMSTPNQLGSVPGTVGNPTSEKHHACSCVNMKSRSSSTGALVLHSTTCPQYRLEADQSLLPSERVGSEKAVCLEKDPQTQSSVVNSSVAESNEVSSSRDGTQQKSRPRKRRLGENSSDDEDDEDYVPESGSENSSDEDNQDDNVSLPEKSSNENLDDDVDDDDDRLWERRVSRRKRTKTSRLSKNRKSSKRLKKMEYFYNNKVFYCVKCYFSTEELSTIKDHCKTPHNMHRCTVCKETFKTRSRLKQHKEDCNSVIDSKTRRGHSRRVGEQSDIRKSAVRKRGQNENKDDGDDESEPETSSEPVESGGGGNRESVSPQSCEADRSSCSTPQYDSSDQIQDGTPCSVTPESDERNLTDERNSPKESQDDDAVGSTISETEKAMPTKTTELMGSANKKRMFCFPCNRIFLKEDVYLRHKENCEDAPHPSTKPVTWFRRLGCYYCSRCNFKSRDKEDILLHIKSHIVCTACGKAFKSVQLLESHSCASVEHTTGLSEKATTDEKHCGDDMPGGKETTRSLDRESTTDGKRCAPKVNDSLACPHCRRILKNDYLLQSHIKIHDNPEIKRYVCSSCGWVYVNRKMLLVHKDKVHSITQGKNGLQCPRCQRILHNNYLLQRHIKMHDNPDNRQHECSRCGWVFTVKSLLQTHMEEVHGEFPPGEELTDFKCSICTRGFKTKNGLSGHLSLHSGPQDSAIKCSRCPCIFSPKLHVMQAHLAKAHGIEPFKAKFMALQMKLRKKSTSIDNNLNVSKDANKSLEEKGLKMTKSTNVLKCSHCPRQFDNLGALGNHLKMHDNLSGEGVKCSLCGWIFKSNFMLNVHMNTKHRNVMMKRATRVPVRIDKKKERFHCVSCNFASSHFETYERHLSTKKHEKLSFGLEEKNGLYICKPCSYETRIWQFINRHLKTHRHGLNVEEFKTKQGSLELSPVVSLKRIPMSPDTDKEKMHQNPGKAEKSGVKHSPGGYQASRTAKLVSDFSDFACKPYACALCFFRCDDLDILNNHVQNHLTGGKRKSINDDPSACKLEFQDSTTKMERSSAGVKVSPTTPMEVSPGSRKLKSSPGERDSPQPCVVLKKSPRQIKTSPSGSVKAQPKPEVHLPNAAVTPYQGPPVSQRQVGYLLPQGHGHPGMYPTPGQMTPGGYAAPQHHPQLQNYPSQRPSPVHGMPPHGGHMQPYMMNPGPAVCTEDLIDPGADYVKDRTSLEPFQCLYCRIRTPSFAGIVRHFDTNHYDIVQMKGLQAKMRAEAAANAQNAAKQTLAEGPQRSREQKYF